jgi:hypothetical protein
MDKYQTPTKEQVRAYLSLRFGSSGPVPSITEIRHAIGWVEQPVRMTQSKSGVTSAREDSTA